MTPQELIEACEQAVRENRSMMVRAKDPHQPIPGFRGVLLSVSLNGIHNYSYTARQAEQIAGKVRREMGL